MLLLFLLVVFYTMDALEAAGYVNNIKPKEVVPIHYGNGGW